jgi:hypothetical protein
VLTTWQYIGSGYLNPGDVLLAAGVEASIRVAREALHDLRCRPPTTPDPASEASLSAPSRHTTTHAHS